MITFKNRFAEFDNLDDSQNENVLKNCYYKEFHKNFLRFNGNNKIQGNLRYSNQNQNYNDIRLKHFRNKNNTIINPQRQSSLTPFPRIPINNQNNMNNNFNSMQVNTLNQMQNPNLLRSSPNYSNLRGNNTIISTPIPFNNVNNNSFNNSSFDNSFNNSNDNIQYFNESQNMFNNNNMDNGLNISNISGEYQYNQNREFQIRRDEMEKAIHRERQKQLLLEQERLNQIEKELKDIRLKRNNDLKRKLEEKKNEERLWNLRRLRNKRIKKNKINGIKIINKNRLNKSFKQSLLEESFKTNMINDRLYMNQLIEEINRMKYSQNEANDQFKRKIDGLFQQNELIKSYNRDLMSKLKEVKYAVKEKEDHPDTINDYLIEQRNKRNYQNKNIFKRGNVIRNNYYNRYFDNDELNSQNYKNYFLGKKDKDEEEFNLLNQNLVNGNNGVVVAPLMYKNNNNKNIKFKSYSRNENNNDDIYSLLRKTNDRLDRIKELEDRMNYEQY